MTVEPEHRLGADPSLAAVVAAVSLGGAAGAVLRHLLALAVPDRVETFPWGTFAVNLSGCLLLGLLPGLAAVRRRPLLAALLGTGVLGGYTTLSTYAEQARSLTAAGRPEAAATYVVATLAGCLLAVAVARAVVGPHSSRPHDRHDRHDQQDQHDQQGTSP